MKKQTKPVAKVKAVEAAKESPKVKGKRRKGSPEAASEAWIAAKKAARGLAAILTVDAGAQLAIQVTLDTGGSLFFVRTRDGATLEVTPTKGPALAFANTLPASCGARVYERRGATMWPVAA